MGYRSLRVGSWLRVGRRTHETAGSFILRQMAVAKPAFGCLKSRERVLALAMADWMG